MFKCYFCKEQPSTVNTKDILGLQGINCSNCHIYYEIYDNIILYISYLMSDTKSQLSINYKLNFIFLYFNGKFSKFYFTIPLVNPKDIKSTIERFSKLLLFN